MKQDNTSLQKPFESGIVQQIKFLPIPVQTPSDEIAPSVFTQWVSYIAPDHIQDLAFHDGNLWAATLGGIVKWSVEGKISRTQFGSEHNLPGSAFRHLAIDGSGCVWVGGQKNGLAWWDGQRWDNSVSNFKDRQDIYCLSVDSAGLLWGCGEQGLGTVDIVDGCAKWHPYHIGDLSLPFKEINSLAIDSKGNLYLGADRGLFYKKTDSTIWNRLTIKDGLQDNKITKLLCLGDDYLWIGTLRGVSVFKDGQAKPIEDIQVCVNGLAYEPDNDAIWISTVKNIYKCTESGTLSFSPPFFKDGRMPTTLTATSKKVWVGFDKGVMHFQPVPTEIQSPRKQNCPVGSINSIFVEENHDIWVGTAAGLWRYKTGSWEKMRPGNQLSTELENINQIVADSGGCLWVSSWQSGKSAGLRMLSKSRVEIPHKRNYAPAGSDAMNLDAQGNLWVAKNDQIYKFDNKQWSVFGTLPDQVELVQSLYVDEKDNIWLGANTGLWRLQNGEWNVVLSKQDVHSVLRNIDGALLVGTSTGIYRCDDYGVTEIKIDLPAPKALSLCQSKNGDLYIGTTEGLVRYRNEVTEVWNIWNSGLAGQVVTQLAMDGERLWVGTNLGLSQFSVED
jgi:ligand-binding sensor domain-containing protein